MKNIYLIFFFALFAVFNASGQGSPTPIGAKNGSLEVLGGIKIDSALKLPFLTNAQAKFIKGGLDTNGYLFTSTTDSLPRYMKKGVIVHSLTEFDSGKLYATPFDVQHSALDTTSLSNRINLRVKYTDTVGMSNRINQKLASTDTASLSNRIDLRVKYTDTIGTSNRIDLRVKYTDTVGMSNRIDQKLNNADTAGLSARIDLRVKYTDTVGMSNRINQKLNSSDTAALSNRIDLRVKYTDTVGMSNRINLKLNSSDTAGLSSRIDLRVKYTDTVGMSNRINLSVPYTGATTDVSLGTHSVIASAVTLAANATPAYVAGAMYYDSGNDCYTIFNSDNQVGLQVGQEDWIRVKNVSGSTITNGSAVYINGSSSGLPTIALAQSNSGTTTVGVGLATESIANNAIGYVTSLGVVHGLNTSGFSVGAVYISATTPGALTQTAPVSPNYVYRVGFVTSVDVSAGTIHVTPSRAFIGNGTEGQVFRIVSGSQAWSSTVGSGSVVAQSALDSLSTAIPPLFGQTLTGRYVTTGSTSVTADGYFAVSISLVSPGNASTITAKSYDATNRLPNYNRFLITTTTGSNSPAEFRTSIAGKGALMDNSTVTTNGGSVLLDQFGFGVYNAGERFFVGYTASTAANAGATDPSAQTNCFGIGKDAADGTLYWIYNDGSGTATHTQITGTGGTVTPNQNDVYIVTITIPANSTSVTMKLDVLVGKTTKNSYTISPSSDLPAIGTLMYQRLFCSAAATGVAVSMAMIQIVEQLF